MLSAVERDSVLADQVQIVAKLLFSAVVRILQTSDNEAKPHLLCDGVAVVRRDLFLNAIKQVNEVLLVLGDIVTQILHKVGFFLPAERLLLRCAWLVSSHDDVPQVAAAEDLIAVLSLLSTACCDWRVLDGEPEGLGMAFLVRANAFDLHLSVSLLRTDRHLLPWCE